MENLFDRIRRLGFLVLLGACLIIYVGLGIIYLQQGAKQDELREQITKINIIVSKPLPPATKLQEEYDKVNQSLYPRMVPEVLQMVVDIAEKSGINVSPDSGMFNIPPPGSPGEQKIGENTYQVLSITNIKVRGSYDSVMAFISDLDSGETQKTMLLKKISISFIEVAYEGQEAIRREEFRSVSSAVMAMMADNGLAEIPNPIRYGDGIAIDYMGDNPVTEGISEGFPDTITTITEKDYSGTGFPRGGYVLYRHDKISTDNTTQFETVTYLDMLTTQYYYTCEADGTVRQFDGPDVATATEYLGSEEYKTETIVTLAVSLYTKLAEGEQL